MPQLGDLAPYTGPDTPLLLLGREPGPDGSYGRSAPDAPLPRDPRDPSLWLPGQGRMNACGTTTLAYVLRYLLGSAAPDRPALDRMIRRADIFSAPTRLVDCARRSGLHAVAYNGIDLDTVLSMTDRGIPVMVLVDTTPLDLTDTANLHWVCVVAHDGDSIGIYNPHGFQQALDRASFEECWREARLFGLPAWSRFAIAVATPGTALPANDGPSLAAIGANFASQGVAGVVNGAVSLKSALTSGSKAQAAAAIPGVLGLVAPAAQTVFGAGVLLGAALARRR
jgi:predicted double-glycine peptidase